MRHARPRPLQRVGLLRTIDDVSHAEEILRLVDDLCLHVRHHRLKLDRPRLIFLDHTAIARLGAAVTLHLVQVQELPFELAVFGNCRTEEATNTVLKRVRIGRDTDFVYRH